MLVQADTESVFTPFSGAGMADHVERRAGEMFLDPQKPENSTKGFFAVLQEIAVFDHQEAILVKKMKELLQLHEVHAFANITIAHWLA